MVWIEFIICSSLMVFFAYRLCREGVVLSEKTRLEEGLIGMFFLALATSFPEGATGATAVYFLGKTGLGYGEKPLLDGDESHGAGSPNSRSERVPGVTVEPRRDIHSQHRASQRIDRLNQRPVGFSQLSLQSRTEEGIHDHVRVASAFTDT